jgi:glycine dehydrogenase
VTVDVENAALVHECAIAAGFNFAQVSQTQVRISFDEETTESDFRKVLDILSLSDAPASDLPAKVVRSSKYLTHPVFNTNHSETAMMRYLRNLSDRDLALDRTMIPLGSCTMKLNSVTEMEAVTWPEFSSLHPFAPIDQSIGSRRLISEL